MQNINLLDIRLLPPRPSIGNALAVVACAAFAAAVLAHGLFEARLTQQVLAAAQAAAEQANAANASATGNAADANAGTTVDAAEPPALRTMRARLAAREGLRQALGTHTEVPPQPAHTLAQIIAALPEAMWLIELELYGARELRISGGTLEPQALSQFAQRLTQVPALRGVGLRTLRLQATRTENGETGPADGGNSDQPGAWRAHHFVLASEANAATPER